MIAQRLLRQSPKGPKLPSKVAGMCNFMATQHQNNHYE
jgi:hypothetical protein